MRVLGIALAVFLTVFGTGGAGNPKAGPKKAPEKLVADFWDAAYLEGNKVGYVHTLVREMERGGNKYFHTFMSLSLVVKRNGEVIQLRMDAATTELDRGRVVGTFMRQYLGPSKKMEIAGVVEGKQIKFTLDGKQSLPPAPWNEEVVGMYRQLNLLAERKVKPGQSFSYSSFEPNISRAVKNFVAVKDYEEIELFQGKTKKRLLRVETKPEKIDMVQLPTLTTWVDEKYVPLRSQVALPGLGQLVMYRTTREEALGPIAVAKLIDIAVRQRVRLKRKIAQPYDTTAAVYRVTVAGDDGKEENPAGIFSRDDRQQVKNLKGNTFELHVRAAGNGNGTGAKPAADYLQSSYFITSGDARVKELARTAVGDAKDPWQKALRIERWVNANMKYRSDEAMATADHVARTLQGDCSEFSMLAAAMCRAEGVPARTALGLIYADVEEGPAFAFHMWTEVWIKGRWLPLDATLGQGHVGATHLKIIDHGWNDVRTQTPLLSLVRVLQKISMEVVSVTGPGN